MWHFPPAVPLIVIDTPVPLTPPGMAPGGLCPIQAAWGDASLANDLAMQAFTEANEVLAHTMVEAASAMSAWDNLAAAGCSL